MSNRIQRILLNWRWWVCFPVNVMFLPVAAISLLLHFLAFLFGTMHEGYEEFCNKIFGGLSGKINSFIFQKHLRRCRAAIAQLEAQDEQIKDAIDAALEEQKNG